MSMKKSVSLSNATVSAITCRYPKGQANYSGAVNLFCDRYRVMVRDALDRVDISVKEWITLFSIYSSTPSQTDAIGSAKMLLAEVADSDEGTPDLQQKIGKLGLSERLVMVDMIERYWAGAADNRWNSASTDNEIIEILIGEI